MIINRQWSMPNRWTFKMAPAMEFVVKHIQHPSIDPFRGTCHLATHSNDIADGVCSREWLRSLIESHGRGWAMSVVFDPPYSPRQVKEHYELQGRKVSQQDTQLAALVSETSQLCWELLKSGGVFLTFGWNTRTPGKPSTMVDFLAINHGGSHNDTLCCAWKKEHPVKAAWQQSELFEETP